MFACRFLSYKKHSLFQCKTSTEQVSSIAGGVFEAVAGRASVTHCNAHHLALEIETCRSVQALLLGVYSPTVSSGMPATVHPLRQFA